MIALDLISKKIIENLLAAKRIILIICFALLDVVVGQDGALFENAALITHSPRSSVRQLKVTKNLTNPNCKELLACIKQIQFIHSYILQMNA
jgi:hypothetical protein